MILDISKEAGNPESQGIAQRIYGQVLASGTDSDWPVAEADFQKSLKTLAETENALELGRGHYQFALALRHRQPEREAEALDHLQQAIAIFRRIGASRDLAQAEKQVNTSGK